MFGGVLPTPKEFLDLMAKDPSTILKDSDEEKKLIWYFDRLLPIGAPLFEKDVRYFSMYGEPVTVKNKTYKVNVTLADEAFTLLCLESCKEKWEKMYKFQVDHPTKDLPSYKGKFTTSTQGQVKYGGWTKEGKEFFNKTQQKLQELRETDKENGYPFANYILKLLRTANDITEDSMLQENQKNNKKKRKTAPKPAFAGETLCLDADSDDEEGDSDDDITVGETQQV